MTPGVVHDLQARVNVVFRLPGRPDLAIECVRVRRPLFVGDAFCLPV